MDSKPRKATAEGKSTHGAGLVRLSGDGLSLFTVSPDRRSGGPMQNCATADRTEKNATGTPISRAMSTAHLHGKSMIIQSGDVLRINEILKGVLQHVVRGLEVM